MNSSFLPLFAQNTQDMLRSARQSHSLGVMLAQAAVFVVALGCVIAAYSTATKGFEITKTRRIQGVPAKVFGAILLAIAIGMAVFAIVFLPGMAF